MASLSSSPDVPITDSAEVLIADSVASGPLDRHDARHHPAAVDERQARHQRVGSVVDAREPEPMVHPLSAAVAWCMDNNT
jgi:hypothetical protein